MAQTTDEFSRSASDILGRQGDAGIVIIESPTDANSIPDPFGFTRSGIKVLGPDNEKSRRAPNGFGRSREGQTLN